MIGPAAGTLSLTRTRHTLLLSSQTTRALSSKEAARANSSVIAASPRIVCAAPFLRCVGSKGIQLFLSRPRPSANATTLVFLRLLPRPFFGIRLPFSGGEPSEWGGRFQNLGILKRARRPGPKIARFWRKS